MTVTKTLDEQLTLLNGVYSLTQPGDNIDDIYTHCQFSNGYECYIPSMSGTQTVLDEVNNVLSRSNSDTPPTNWQPYNGFVAS